GSESLLEDDVRGCLGALSRGTRAKPTEHVQPHDLLDVARSLAQPIPSWQNCRLHGDRNPGVRLFADGLTEERRGRDANDGNNPCAKRDRGADDVTASSEPTLPEVVGDHGVRSRLRGRL